MSESGKELTMGQAAGISFGISAVALTLAILIVMAVTRRLRHRRQVKFQAWDHEDFKAPPDVEQMRPAPPPPAPPLPPPRPARPPQTMLPLPRITPILTPVSNVYPSPTTRASLSPYPTGLSPAPTPRAMDRGRDDDVSNTPSPLTPTPLTPTHSPVGGGLSRELWRPTGPGTRPSPAELWTRANVPKMADTQRPRLPPPPFYESPVLGNAHLATAPRTLPAGRGAGWGVV